MVVAFPTWTGSEFQTDEPDSHFASSEWELLASDVGTGVKWSKRGVQL